MQRTTLGGRPWTGASRGTSSRRSMGGERTRSGTSTQQASVTCATKCERRAAASVMRGVTSGAERVECRPAAEQLPRLDGRADQGGGTLNRAGCPPGASVDAGSALLTVTGMGSPAAFGYAAHHLTKHRGEFGAMIDQVGLAIFFLQRPGFARHPEVRANRRTSCRPPPARVCPVALRHCSSDEGAASRGGAAGWRGPVGSPSPARSRASHRA